MITFLYIISNWGGFWYLIIRLCSSHLVLCTATITMIINHIWALFPPFCLGFITGITHTVRTVLPTCWFVIYQLLKSTFIHQLPHGGTYELLLYRLIVLMENLYYLLEIFIIRCYCNVHFIVCLCIVLCCMVLCHCTIAVCMFASVGKNGFADYCEGKLKIKSNGIMWRCTV